jgi:hypothetical protein
MKHTTYFRFVLPFCALTASCRTTNTEAEQQQAASRCQQTYEFGNYGCAQLQIAVEWPAKPWPAYRIDVRAVPARPSPGTMGLYSEFATPAVVPIRVTRFAPDIPSSGDTISMWISARILADTNDIKVTGVPLPTYAGDSALRVVHFAPVGEIAPVDTVRLVVRPTR